MIDSGQRLILLGLAEASLRHALQRGRSLPVVPDDFEHSLREPGACFVTLHRHGQLRGCIGSLEAYRPLVRDVAENAFAAGFRDPRFLALTIDEWPGLDLEISVLGAAHPMAVDSEQALLAQLRPGIDGLILEEPGHRATFLPTVWKSLPEPSAFLHHLKQKAGLAPDYWSSSIRFSRYTTEGFGRPIGPWAPITETPEAQG